MKLTQAQYARLCGVSRQAIEQKVYKGLIICDIETIAGKQYKLIDTDKYPIEMKGAKQ